MMKIMCLNLSTNSELFGNLIQVISRAQFLYLRIFLCASSIFVLRDFRNFFVEYKRNIRRVNIYQNIYKTIQFINCEKNYNLAFPVRSFKYEISEHRRLLCTNILKTILSINVSDTSECLHAVCEKRLKEVDSISSTRFFFPLSFRNLTLIDIRHVLPGNLLLWEASLSWPCFFKS
uniref:Putative serine protease n=1 Tax=Ixodes ricinus TaxID=34613 RepID=A0A0K8R9H8_IXORI